jgi:hypothetical protein
MHYHDEVLMFVTIAIIMIMIITMIHMIMPMLIKIAMMIGDDDDG